ncbi:hypothetical protein ACFXHA_37875 [Nocardia sp. NPDC059240]|uniref:hypothetical protein n=1 Tax=Nocardia sp. NPDC059240 TaxID=3346786 RepID=UPI003696214F
MQESPRENGADDWIPDFGLSHTGTIGVTVAARAEMLPMLRSVVETVLLTADFTLDVVADVRVAIDEIVTALVGAAEGVEVACALRYDRHRVEVRVSALTSTADVLPKNSLSRHLLESMVDGLSIDYRADQALETYRMVVCFDRRRTGHWEW